MDKKYEDMSYKEIHNKLEEAMQDALTSDEACPFESPEIDYSFMDKGSKKNKSGRRPVSFNKVAAIIVIVLLGMNIVMMATDSGVSYSEKGLLHRIYEGARGIFTDEDESEYVEIDETGEVHVITELNAIKQAKSFCDELYMPQYIPDEFELKELRIEKKVDGNFIYRYEFFNKNEFLIIESIGMLNDRNSASNNTEKTINLTDRKINIYYDSINKYHVADVYFEDSTVYISSNISLQEIELVATNIID